MYLGVFTRLVMKSPRECDFSWLVYTLAPAIDEKQEIFLTRRVNDLEKPSHVSRRKVFHTTLPAAAAATPSSTGAITIPVNTPVLRKANSPK